MLHSPPRVTSLSATHVLIILPVLALSFGLPPESVGSKYTTDAAVSARQNGLVHQSLLSDTRAQSTSNLYGLAHPSYSSTWLKNATPLVANAAAAVDLSLTHTDNVDPIASGQPLTYSVTVTNNGPDPATGVVVTEALHPTTNFVAATPSVGTCAQTPNVVTCDLGTLSSGLTAIINVIVTPTLPGIISATATVTSTSIESDGANNSLAQQTRVSSAVAAPSVVNATVLNPPDLTNSVGLDFEIALVESTGLVYIGTTGFYGEEVGVINPDSNTLIAVIPTPGSGVTGFSRVNQAASIVYFTGSFGGSTLFAIDGRPGSQTFNRALPPFSLAGQTIVHFDFDEARGLMYVTSFDTSNQNSTKISIVDANPASPTFHQVRAEVPFPLGAQQPGVGVNSVSNKIYFGTTGTQGGVYVLDGTSLVLTRITNAVNSRNVIVNPVSNLIFAGSSNLLNVIDGINDSLLTTINLPSSIFFSNEGGAINKTTGRVYLRSANSVLVIDGQRGSPTFNTVVAQIATDPGSEIVANETLNRVVLNGQQARRTTIIDGATNTVVAFIPSSQLPSDIALNTQTHRAYIANQFNFVQKINVGSATLEATILTGVNANPGEVHSANQQFYLGLLNATSDVLSFNQAGQFTQVNGLPHTDGRYTFFASNSTTNRIYAQNNGSQLSGGGFSLPGFLSVIDGSNNTVLVNVVVGNQPIGLAVNQATNKVYVTNAGFGPNFPPSVMVIDGTSNVVTNADVSAFAANTQFSGPVVVNGTANKAYFRAGQGMGILNAATNVVTPLNLAGEYRVNNSLNRLYVLFSNASGVQLAIVDGNTNATVTTLNIGPSTIGPSTFGLNQTTGRIFVANSGNNTISVVDGNTNAIESTIPMSGGPSILSTNELVNRVYVGSAANRTLSVLNGSTLAVVATLALPFRADTLAVDPTASTLYATSSGAVDQAGVAVIRETSHSITGGVRDSAGTPLVGVGVTLSGTVALSTTTNASGTFAFNNLPEGRDFTVAPTSADYSFNPASHIFNPLNVDRIANFVGTRTSAAISGRVSNGNNVGINGVTLALTKNGLSAGTVQSNAQGDYIFANLETGAAYLVTPQGSFTPSSQTFGNLTVNTVANFTAAPSIPPQCNTVSFGRTDFAAGTGRQHVAIGDFNGDGKSDLAVANESSDNVSILLGTGTGSFSAATNFVVGLLPTSVAIGDFNSDGKSDLAVANRGFGNVSVLLGTGTGSFGVATNFAAAAGSEFVVIGDFNSDGKNDLAVANGNSANVSILLGAGTGSFGVATNFAVGPRPISVAIGDFNGDGKSDLAVANRNSDNVSILLGTGTGSFSAATSFVVGTLPFSVAIGDFNGDGKSDLAVANSLSNNISILLGTGRGSFGAPTNFAASGPQSVAIGDFNGDGKSDLAVANFQSNNISILLGAGTGSFGAATSFAVGDGPLSVAIGDFNGDAKSDLAVANFFSAFVSILLNNGATCNSQSTLSISGRIAAANNNSLAEVIVTLSGPITRVTQSDINGNYSFANLIPGGNYAVTAQSPYYALAPSRVDFFNLSINQTANLTAAPVVVPVSLPPPSDDFNASERDASKWSLGTLTQPAGSFDPQVTVRQVNGQLVITPLTQASGMHYNGYVSANSFDLRGGSVSVELVQAATGGADSIFAIGSDSDNFYRFIVHTAGPGPTPVPTVRGRDGIERPLDTTVAQLIFQVNVGGQLTAVSIPYDPVQHRFMRFRHDAPANAIAFETSANNIDFTERHRVTLARSVSALTAELSAGTSNPTNPGATVFDNFGLVTSTFQFSAASYMVEEGGGSILITVTRAGSMAGTATVDYATSDGTAQQSSDYILAAGRLMFAAGEASKTFRVLIVDNAQAEGNQNLNLLLQEPAASGLNTPGRAVLIIVDNDTTVATVNPLEEATFYVTQHYYDFLNREADAPGLAFWVDQITSCGSDTQCIEIRRINVSAAYFLSIEFQETGFLAHRFYNLALNRPNGLPRYLEFFRDSRAIGNGVVIGAPGADALLEANKVAYANEFAGRAEYTALYPLAQTPAEHVDALYAHAGITPSAAERQAAIDEFNTPAGARGRVLRRVAENPTLRAREFNRAFVLAQYFGYLRRNPDDAPDNNLDGYNFWLNKLNQFNGNFVDAEMVKAFILSGEYRQRFGP